MIDHRASHLNSSARIPELALRSMCERLVQGNRQHRVAVFPVADNAAKGARLPLRKLGDPVFSHTTPNLRALPFSPECHGPRPTRIIHYEGSASVP